MVRPRDDDNKPEADASQSPGPTPSRQSWLLTLSTALLLVSSVGNSTFFKLMIDKFHNYALFISQITSLVYIPVFGALVLLSKDITPEMRAFPKSKFFVMGALDSMAGILMTFGGIMTSGSLQALLMQALIPTTLILSVIVLRTRYSRLQYCGAFIIVAGVCVVLVPQALQPSDTKNNFVFNIIFLLSVIPQAFSSVFKEIAFDDAELDVNYLQYWVAVWQVAFGLVVAPVNSVKLLGPAAVPLQDIPMAIWNGAKCMCGVNTVLASATNAIPDSCAGAWIPLSAYIAFNLLYNISIMLVIKHGSAALMYFAMTLRLPIIQVVFALPFMPGGGQPFSLYAVIGLFVILLGLSIYRWASSRQPSGAEEEDIQMIPGALEPPACTLTRKSGTLLLRRRSHDIRHGFYSRLGLPRDPSRYHPVATAGVGADTDTEQP
ncbi:EamA domain-containing protein [Plasmodiophora brassicae]